MAAVRFLVESLVLCLIGGAIGVVVAQRHQGRKKRLNKGEKWFPVTSLVCPKHGGWRHGDARVELARAFHAPHELIEDSAGRAHDEVPCSSRARCFSSRLRW